MLFILTNQRNVAIIAIDNTPSPERNFAMSNISEKIRDLRKRKGVSQAAIAEYLGITKQAYSLYETGKREPDFETLLQLAKYFDTDADSLLTGSDTARVSDTRLKFALFGDAEIDDEVLDDVKRLAKLHLELRRSKEQEEKK